jgi:hypothetical protein
MNQAQFVQIPCSKCGTIVWIAPAAGVGYCPSCHTPNQLPAGGAPQQGGPPMGGAPPGAYGAPQQGGYGAPGAPGAYGAPQQGGYGAPPGAPGMPGAPPAPGGYGAPMQPPMQMRGVSAGGGGNTLKAVGGGILAVVVALGYGALRFGKSFLPKPGIETLANLGIDKKKGDPDKMIAGAAAYAKKWKSDAGFWSVNIGALSADGTIDLTSSNVTVEYFSPSAVSSPLQTIRDDSIKKFNFIEDNMQYKDVWGVKKQYSPPPRPTPIPGCTAKMLAAVLVKAGSLKSGATIQATIDPQFSDSWIVQTPTIPTKYDIATCAKRDK